MFVHFTDSEQTTIDTVFAGPQDPEAWPNMGEVEEDDQRLLDFLNPSVFPEVIDPVQKLMMFLKENPDVSELLK